MSYDDYKWKKRKYYIRINCWIIMLILVAILCFMFPIISDASEVDPVPEGYISVGSFLGIVEDDLYLNSNTNIDALPEGYINPLSWNVNDEFGYNMLDNDLSNGEILLVESDLNLTLYSTIPSYETFDISEFSYYFIDISGQYHIPTLYLDNDFIGGVAPSMNYSASGGVENRSYSYDSDFNVQGVSFSFSSLLSGYDNVYILRLNNHETSHFSSYSFGTYDSVNDHYSDLIVPAVYGNSNCLWCTNIPNINTISPSLRDGGDDLRILDQITLSYSSDILGSPNFAITHNYSNNSTFPDGSGGTDENNLYMRTADWTFNIPKYWPSVTSSTVQSQYVNNWGQGYINFSGLLNDYQKSNSDNFDIDFNFHIWASGHYFSDVVGSVNGNFYGSFDYSDSVSLTTFVNNNNMVSFSVKDIFDFAINNSNVYFSDFIDDNMKGHQSIDNWNWYITCDACLSSADKSSGHITEKYNFISQVSEETSNNIIDNTNPFIPDQDDPNYNPDNINPDNDSNITTSKNGINISITNNNDPTFTNNNNFNPINSVIPDGDGGTDENGDNLLTWIIKKLFGYIDALVGGIFDASGLNDNNDGVTQNSLITGDSLGTSNNGFLAFLNSTFTFIPQGMWNVLQYFFTVSIVILIIAFLIRIILDIL